MIVDRGDGKVIRRLANNASARFSEAGYSGLIAHADGDDELVEILGLRLDLPIQFLRDLLRRAKDAVRDRLLAIAPAVGARRRSAGCWTAIVQDEPAGPGPRLLPSPKQLVKLMKNLNELDDAAIVKFVGSGKFDEVAAALALLNDVPTGLMARVAGRSTRRPAADPLQIRRPRLDGGRDHPAPPPVVPRSTTSTVWQAHRDYGRLSVETAQRTVRFWQLHNRIEKVG